MRTRHSLLVAVAGLVLLAGGHVVGVTRAAFSGATTNPSTFQAKRIYSGTRSWSAWDLRDSSSGTETNVSDIEAFTGLTKTTGRWSNAWSTARYLTYDMNDPLPAALAVTGAAFEFDFADAQAGTGDQVCFYFEVVRRSTGAVLGTHGSSAAPVACQITNTLQTIVTAIPEVTTSDLANDVRIKVYGMQTTSRRMIVDRTVVTGSTSAGAFTLYETTSTDAAAGAPTITPWPISVGDANGYQNASAWPTAFGPTRYLKLTFPSYLAATTAIASAQLVHTSSVVMHKQAVFAALSLPLFAALVVGAVACSSGAESGGSSRTASELSLR